MQIPRFITLAEIIEINFDQVASFGGTPGVRDEGLLESAISQPQATFGGEYLHSTIYAQAAAYLYHIAMNHPFIDGNKRTAFAAMDTFLLLNGYALNLTDEQAYAMVIQVARGMMSNEELTDSLEKCVVKQDN